jgi:hypothetical protein
MNMAKTQLSIDKEQGFYLYIDFLPLTHSFIILVNTVDTSTCTILSLFVNNVSTIKSLFN